MIKIDAKIPEGPSCSESGVIIKTIRNLVNPCEQTSSWISSLLVPDLAGASAAASLAELGI
jgi:hypothetical protein